MRGASLFPVVAGIPFACVDALSLHKRDVPAVVEIPIERRQTTRSLQKRDSTVGVSLQNIEDSYYSLNLTLGTPGQQVMLTLDTGSSDLWVNIPNSTYCSADDDPCSPYGVFTASDSSTIKTVGTYLNDTYADGSNLYGPYVTDKVTVGNTTIDDMQFGLADSTTVSHGIVGVGYQIATYQSEHDGKVYANLPQALVDSGAIKSAAYSLWLDGLEATTGSILFGGVNTAKYTGDLQTLPIVPVDDDYYSLAIALTEVGVETDSDSTSYTDSLPLSVSLDSGTTMTALPSDLVDKIYKALNATYVEKYDMPYIDCDVRDTDYNVTYSFSGAKITVGMNQLIIPATEPDFPKGTCILGLVPSQPGINLLGDTFLRSAYVVYDLANNEISVANTNFNPGDDDILEIGTGTSAVPGATLVPSAVSSATGNGVATTEGAVPTLSGASTVTLTATGSASSSTGTGKSGDSAKATSTSSKGFAALPTSNSINLLSGLAGAGLLLSL
ncbi:yapsin [Aspergillus sclerotiicarbonarius CBS 121057]|uniref:Yapsin n=1 Tax=Aspergillus sclerotiicarbonarius (strain CBS 121057 / IBT 28362) TaxID=1448318 RepID=A0A319EFS8_ASPSB|nr:yapsin [Aspergillus sclerotiicarbonarius CBS 121057]